MVSIKIISGSTRPGRFSKQVSDWAYSMAQKHDGEATVELIDLAEVDLPLLDESIPPSQANYQNEHTKEWSSVIDGADGFLVVTPEYNHSLPAALKNAFDFLYKEWNYKPVSFVSYGSGAGGARAVEHLRGIAGELKMYDLREQLLLPNYWNDLSEQGEYGFTAEQAESLDRQISDLIFWAAHMRDARAALAERRKQA